jgi:HTH-type transcriptional regulator, sugar sensing transcriptional regulator
MNTEILGDLGLTNAEIKVYLALLELGSSSAGPILEKSKLQNSVVHMTLHKLIDKGLITYIKQGKRNLYQATNPNHLLEFVDEKKRRIKEILPELLIKQKLAKEKPEIITFSNIRGIRELLDELLSAGGTEHLTFGSTKQSLILGEAWWVDYHKKRASKGIKAKLLFNESLGYWKAETKYSKSEIRYTEEGFEPLTETIIRNNKIAIIIWTEKPIGVLINNELAAKSYKQFFNLIWKNSRK